MSVRAMNAVWEGDREHSGTTLLLLLAMADAATDDGSCHATVVELARKARCSERSAYRALNSLTEDGTIRKRESRSGAHYQIVLPAALDMTDRQVDGGQSMTECQTSDDRDMTECQVDDDGGMTECQEGHAPSRARVLFSELTTNKQQQLHDSYESWSGEPDDNAEQEPWEEPASHRETERDTARDEPTPQQAMYGAVCNACGLDPGLMDTVTRTNVGKLASALRKRDIEPDFVRSCGERWFRERFPGKSVGDVSPPTVAQLRTWIGRCLAEPEQVVLLRY